MTRILDARRSESPIPAASDVKDNDTSSSSSSALDFSFLSYVVPDKALMGSFPNYNQVRSLVSLNVKYVVDLTEPSERKRLYKHKHQDYRVRPDNKDTAADGRPEEMEEDYYPMHLQQEKICYLNFPIRDNTAPANHYKCYLLIVWLAFILENLDSPEKMYIHCRGGHGRSPMICILLLSYLFQIGIRKSQEWIVQCYLQRQNLRPKWKKMCASTTAAFPSSTVQRRFLSCFPHRFPLLIRNSPPILFVQQHLLIVQKIIVVRKNKIMIDTKKEEDDDKSK